MTALDFTVIGQNLRRQAESLNALLETYEAGHRKSAELLAQIQAAAKTLEEDLSEAKKLAETLVPAPIATVPARLTIRELKAMRAQESHD